MEPLLALQELDAQILELQHEIRDIPSRQQHETERLKEAQERLTAAQTELRAFQTRVADFELQVQAVRDRIVKLKQQQMTLKSNKEFRAMEAEINNAMHEAEGLEGQQIMAMDAVVPIKAKVAMNEARVAEERQGNEAFMKELEQRLTQARARLQELETERAAAAVKVNQQQLRVYDRLRKSRRPTIVRLADGVCGGCHLEQPPSIRHLVKRDNALVTCQMCGRLLYG
ncbi:MAG: C4-type zinc ribbon domain-containing protein [Kiritimatiellae bacterium]|nr:C4-type zinc ribbon domain-containing protein [Kiritimatiellia bacterium]